MEVEYTILSLLNERINRVLFQNELINRHEVPLISVQLKYPGINAGDNIIIDIIEIMDDLLCNMFKDSIYEKVFTITEEGPILIILVEKDALDIKKTVMEIENKHTLGYCINIDVYDTNCNIVRCTNLSHDYEKTYNISNFNECNKKLGEEEIIR